MNIFFESKKKKKKGNSNNDPKEQLDDAKAQYTAVTGKEYKELYIIEGDSATVNSEQPQAIEPLNDDQMKPVINDILNDNVSFDNIQGYVNDWSPKLLSIIQAISNNRQAYTYNLAATSTLKTHVEALSNIMKNKAEILKCINFDTTKAISISGCDRLGTLGINLAEDISSL